MTTTVVNLDDINQTAFYIPFSGADCNDTQSRIPLPSHPNNDYDLEDGERQRIEAYRAAWNKCRDRVHSVIHALHAPVVAQIISQVRNAYSNTLLGLPYPELPVICITNSSSGSYLMDQISAQIDSAHPDETSLEKLACFTTHLYPTDCINITATMRALIAGFVDRPHVLGKAKSRPATSLANHDIELLVAWYIAIQEAYDMKGGSKPKLVVVLHEFEQFEPAVIQDLFQICSPCITRIPLLFLLSLSSPPSPSYLQMTYPRSILALLRVYTCTVPSGTRVFEDIILKTYFDVEFEPDIVIGPNILAFLRDFSMRQTSSLDSCFTILHLAHLKHFSLEPLSLLVQNTPSADILSRPTSFQFLDAMLSHSYAFTDTPTGADTEAWSQQTISSLLASIETSRVKFYSRARRLRIGFGLLRLIQSFMRSQGYKGLDWDQGAEGNGTFDLMVNVMRSKVGPDLKYLRTMVKNLRPKQLGALLEQLHLHFQAMSLRVRSSEDDARSSLVSFINTLPQQFDDDISGVSAQVAGTFGEWLQTYLTDLLAPLEDARLWEIWYTGLSPFPSELINPSIRASLLSGLLRPHDFAGSIGVRPEERHDNFSLWELPDTSILFRRYLDSGRMINVYDWFESFQLVLETQRKNLKKTHESENARHGQKSLRKSSGKEKQKLRQPPQPNAPPEDGDGEDRWKVEVQARFMRALQELDYLGFIKHTGRKADHVQRTVFDMHD